MDTYERDFDADHDERYFDADQQRKLKLRNLRTKLIRLLQEDVMYFEWDQILDFFVITLDFFY